MTVVDQLSRGGPIADNHQHRPGHDLDQFGHERGNQQRTLGLGDRSDRHQDRSISVDTQIAPGPHAIGLSSGQDLVRKAGCDQLDAVGETWFLAVCRDRAADDTAECPAIPNRMLVRRFARRTRYRAAACGSFRQDGASPTGWVKPWKVETTGTPHTAPATPAWTGPRECGCG